MALTEDKENVAPHTSSDSLSRKGSSPAKSAGGRKGRSKSIGPGELDTTQSQSLRQDSKNRRKSAFVPASKAIISTDSEKAERQAARRRTLANRRVSFAPEATLHTWDVIEFMRDHTTSTDASDQTRRTSNITGSSNGGSPFKSPVQSSDNEEPPSTPPEQEDEPKELPASPSPQRDLHRKQRRRSSERSSDIPPMDFNNPEEVFSSSGMSGSSDASGSEEEEDDAEDDATGTAMSLDASDETVRSSESGSSTSSSLTTRLKQAADMAGTRGIEYDEHGEGIEGTMSMEIAGEEITNAFKPWAQLADTEPVGSASLDQENVNPFSPAFKAQIVSGTVTRPATIEEEETGDLSMDVTRAVGGIMKSQGRLPASSPLGDATMDVTRALGGISKPQARLPASSPLGDDTMDVTRAVGGILKPQTQQAESSPLGEGTMDITQAVGMIHTAGQKRRRSTTEAGSPSATARTQSKRSRRSSVARSSMGDDTMDLTMAIGGIQESAQLTKNERRKSVARRRSSGLASEIDEATMEFTRAVGGIKAAAALAEPTASSLDENEELTMELTTFLGGIKAGETAATADIVPSTPPTAQSPVRNAVNTTPKDQERFRDAPDSGPKKLLTPLFQKQVSRSSEKNRAMDRRRMTISPAKVSWVGAVFDEKKEPEEDAQARFEPVAEEEVEQMAKVEPEVKSRMEAELEHAASAEDAVSHPGLPVQLNEPVSPVKETPPRTPPSRSQEVQLQLDAQLSLPQPSPIAEKVLRSTPVRPASTPGSVKTGSPQQTTQSPYQEASTEPRSTLADSIRLLSTPRKETLKALTPKKSAAKVISPIKATTPRLRLTPKILAKAPGSPTRQLSDDLLRVDESEPAVTEVHLHDFLEEAGIRFMDLTATKRRLTTAPTPSKARKTRASQGAEELIDAEVNLEKAVVTAACTQPEHDMFQHACHELKHYISEGKKVIKQLEAETYQETPPLIQAYVNASPGRKAALDAQMRDMKTHARFRSKEMWYAWRSQLLEDLMKGLSGIGEGLLRDDEVLQRAEQVLDQVLPGLVEQQDQMQQGAERLEQAASATSEEEKEELEAARARLIEVDAEVEEKQLMLEQLQRQAREQEDAVSDLQENRAEFTAAIQEAERVREACRGVSLNEIGQLKDSIKNLEDTYGWSIASASSAPPTVTMTYKAQLQLFFHPSAFQLPSQPTRSRPNAPISLSYIAQDRNQQPKELTTTLRFFLQLLRASLQALPQTSTRVPDLLRLVSNGWDTALSVAESERRLNIETLTTARIVSDERIALESTILLPKVRTKVRVAFELLAAVGAEMQLSTTVDATAMVVYGEQYNDAKMTKFVNERITGVADGWGEAVRGLREKLVATGAKGFRK